MKNILRWCFKNITQKYPGRILILALLLSGFSIYVSKGLSYDSRMDNLLPQDLPLIKEFNEVVSKTGGSGPLVIVLEGLTQDKVIKPNQTGLSLAWSYMPHSFGIRCGKMKTPMEIYKSEEHFKKGIKKLLTGSFFGKFTPNYLMPVMANLFDDGLGASAESKHKSESVMRSLLRRYTGTQCVSNFRPTAAACLYSHFAFPGAMVWDMSMGYGGRILGAIISDINYIGTDPAEKTFKGLQEIKKDFGKSERHYILNKCGSETFEPKENCLDFAFTSPPYFNWEQYGEEDGQSFNQYEGAEDWNNGFLRKTIQNAYKGLKKGRHMGLNVANIKSHKTFEDDTVRIAVEEGFTHTDTYKLQLSSQESGAKYEPVFIFQKK